MSRVLITSSLLDDLADAVAAKSGESAPMTIEDMTDAVEGIETVNNQNKTVAPSTSQQTVSADSGYTGLGSVTVSAMPTGTAGTPTATKGTVSNHSVSVTPSVTNTTGYITGSTKTGTAVTVSASELVSGTYTVSSSGTADITNYAAVSVPQADPYVTMNFGYYTENNVRKWKIEPRAEVTVSEGDTAGWVADGFQKTGEGRIYSAISTGTTVTPTTSAQTVGGTNYMMEGAVTVAAMPTGTAGTPTATKGTVSNHSVSVTPSVTNTTGYIIGSTKTGTAVTVSASELVSGSETKTSNGTYDVTNLATLVVNVSGSSKNAQVVQSTTRTGASALTAIGAELTVSKTGTYDIYYSCFRTTTSASYTWATRLYINGVAYGTAENTTWTNNQQNTHLTNISLTAGDKLRVYGRNTRGTSYYICAPMLAIVEA